MNNIWSENIQGIKTLYLSRKLRFDDFFYGQYEKLFSLDKRQKLKILEIGCGPGALAGALHRWYPNAEIVAIDRDSNFIEYAKENVSGVTFIEGDATALPFETNTFDVTISNTVCEHIEPAIFYSEQKRVLKDNGVCLVLSARKGVKYLAECLKMTEIEKRFWDSISDEENVLEKYSVGKYSMTEQELPIVMENNGFVNVSTGYAVIDLTPDNPKYSPQMAEDIINAERASELESVQSVKSAETNRIIDAINKKYDSRIELYRKGNKQWDTITSITMVIRGINRK
ncbi:MAG: class I SAM-dependent methyltransferase [Lachnospiraceae bacterium]|nr:class I SAM-dependent methyltransferase [Lachnospiraceae bacterium]